MLNCKIAIAIFIRSIAIFILSIAIFIYSNLYPRSVPYYVLSFCVCVKICVCVSVCVRFQVYLSRSHARSLPPSLPRSLPRSLARPLALCLRVREYVIASLQGDRRARPVCMSAPTSHAQLVYLASRNPPTKQQMHSQGLPGLHVRHRRHRWPNLREAALRVLLAGGASCP